MKRELDKQLNDSMGYLMDAHRSVLVESSKLITHGDIVSMLSYDVYKEIAIGIYDRLIYDGSDVRDEVESKHSELIKGLDFVNYTHIFVKHYKELDKNINGTIRRVRGEFKLHHHDVNETITCLDGEYIGGSKIYRPGDKQFIRAGDPHVFRSNSWHGLVLISLEKPRYGDQR